MRKGIQFWPAARHFPEQNFIGNLETAAVTQDMRKKLKCSLKSALETKVGKRKTRDFRTQSLSNYGFPADLPFFLL